MQDAQPLPSSELERAIELAFKALARRDLTVAEMHTALERKRVEPDSIEAAVERLTADGFLDDQRYARRFAEDKRTLERWGSERIARDLRKRGVAPELIEATVATQDRAGELETALMLLAARVPEPPEDDRQRDRAWRLLIRRGYEPELAYEAVRAHARRARADRHAA